jgi:hypothetical protein
MRSSRNRVFPWKRRSESSSPPPNKALQLTRHCSGGVHRGTLVQHQSVRSWHRRRSAAQLSADPLGGDTGSVREVSIEEVSVDPLGCLVVRPRLSTNADLAFIYRAAADISWNPESRSLIAPAPKEWSYADWFDQMRFAVSSEYGQRLTLTADTAWANVPDEVRAEIERRAR